MFGRGEDDVANVGGTEWTKRVDRLLAGNLNQQIGSTLESIGRDFAELAQRVDALTQLRAELSALARLVAERSESGIADAVAGIERSLAGFATREDVSSAVRDAAPNLDGVEARVQQALDRLADAVEKKLEASHEQVDNLGRQVGGALGRLRVQNDEIASAVTPLREDVASAIAPLREEMAAAMAPLREEIASGIAPLREEIASVVERVVQSRVDSMRNRLEQKIAAIGESLRAVPTTEKIEELSASIGAIYLRVDLDARTVVPANDAARDE
jgi:chromosome segregation ATPase